MNLMLVGLQSSGSSVVATLLSQRPDTLGIIDTWIRHANQEEQSREYEKLLEPAMGKYPRLLGKITLRTWDAFSQVGLWSEILNADRMVFVVRNPYCNAQSLKEKPYRGSIGKKLKQMEKLVLSDTAPVLFFEDLIFRQEEFMKQMDFWGVDPEHFNFPRNPFDITAQSNAEVPWCKKHYPHNVGTGNVHTVVPYGRFYLALSSMQRDVPASVIKNVDRCVPRLVKWYFDRRPEYRSLSSAATIKLPAMEGDLDPSTQNS